jgi:hypothetical protein
MTLHDPDWMAHILLQMTQETVRTGGVFNSPALAQVNADRREAYCQAVALPVDLSLIGRWMRAAPHTVTRALFGAGGARVHERHGLQRSWYARV